MTDQGVQPHRERWSVAAPFFTREDARWLDDFVSDERLSFRKVAASPDDGLGWHGRRVRGTPVSDWKHIWNHARRAGGRDTDGIITLFPQLAAMAGLQNGAGSRKIVAWCFNVGARPGLPQRLVARRAFRRVDRFIVHATGEIPVIADWFDIPPERIRFVHLQQAPLAIVREEDGQAPFIAALGSADRDYRTFFEAIAGTGIPARVLAAPRALAGLDVPANVTILPPMSSDASRSLAQAARVSVIPLQDTPTASGQVTVVEAMRMRRPIVATRTVGTRDYIDDRETGMLVEPGNAEQLRRAIVELWEDPRLRTRIADGGHGFAERTLSDEAGAASLASIIREL